MSEEDVQIFLREKPSKILVSLSNPSKENYASALSTNVGCTYSHTVRLLQKFEDLGLIETEKKGRKKIMTLTDKGEKVASNLSEVLDKLRS